MSNLTPRGSEPESHKNHRREFFKFAALLANPQPRGGPENQAMALKKPFGQSPWLEPKLQHSLASFSAEPGHHNHSGTSSPIELTEAALFHKSLLEKFSSTPAQPFRLVGTFAREEKSFLISYGHILYSHRLKNKSWQMNAGVASDVRYFHAILGSLERGPEINVVYWLKMPNQESVETGEGAFINLSLAQA